MTSEESTANTQLQPATKTASRLFFIDHWRAALIILVVLHHIAVIYGANTPFYYLEPNDILASIVLTIFQLLNQAWFMGAFFLISGYFTPGSFDRKGSGSFLKDRLLRLGIPLLIFMFVLNPIASIGIYQMPASLTHITTPLTWQQYPYFIHVGPLWFVAILLIFDFGYAAWRAATRNRATRPSTATVLPDYRVITAFVLVLALASYLVRIVVPLGKYVLGYPTLSYLPQYLGLFLVGVIAFRGNWFRTLPSSMGKWGFRAALVATLTLFPLALIGKSGFSGNFLGNGYWQSAVYALWDSILSVGMCLALITLFRRFFSGESRLGSFLSRHGYTVFIIHCPIIVFLAIAVRGIHLENLLKFGMLAIVGVPLCFAVAYLVRKIPGASRIL